MVIITNGDQRVYINEKTGKVYADEAMTLRIDPPAWCNHDGVYKDSKNCPKPGRRRGRKPKLQPEEEIEVEVEDLDPIVVAHGSVFMHDAPRAIIEEAKSSGLA